MKTHLHKRLRAVLCAGALLVTLTPWDGLEAQAEDTYLVRDPFYNFNSGYNYYESEHFQFIWGNSGNSGQVTQAFLEGNAANMEECWDIYVNDLGMAPPCESVEEYLRDGNKYKTNIYISGTGLANMEDDWAYMSWDSGGFAYMFCDVGAMVADPPSWVLPHEFGHVMTAHQLGWNRNKYSGSWWEALANWFREEWLYATGNTVGNGTDFFETYLKSSSLTFPCGRDYYAAWPFMIYLTENPDNLEGYGQYFVRDMLQQGQVDEYPLMMIERLAPQTDFKDTLGHFAKRMALFDFEHGESYRTRLYELFAQGSWNYQQIYTMLERAYGTENVYAVPTERAPQAAGLNLVPLTVTGSEISVTLRGLTNVKGADWRACIVQESTDGTVTYSDLFSDGETMTVPVVSDYTAYLTVIATPDSDTYVPCGLAYQGSEFAEENCSYRSKTQYPYEVVLDGAVPTERKLTVYASGHTHANGGGFVANTANVADTAYVGPNAMVLGYATVSENAVITDYAVVEGSARVSGNATISGYGMVCENGSVSDNAIVTDCGLVMGRASVTGNAKVIESACVYGDYSLTDNAVAKGLSFCMYNGSASGQGMVDGDYYDDGGKTVTKGTAYGWVSAQSYVNALPYTDGLFMSYDFDTDSSATAADRYTSTYATAKNSPLWESVRTSANGVLTFDGATQYLELDRSLTLMGDTEIQFAVLWKGGAAEQNLFYFGDGSSYMKFTPSNANGVAEFIISDGTTTERLTASAPLTAGEWSTVRILLSDDNGSLKINGETVASGTVTLNPTDISGDGSISSSYCSFLGRGLQGDYFKGSVDFFSVYFKEATEPTYYYTETEEIEESGVLYGDVDCNQTVNIADVVLLARFVSQDTTLAADTVTAQGKINADVNLDASITSTDITGIGLYLANLGALPMA